MSRRQGRRDAQRDRPAPPDWANYGEMISAFEAKYGITIESAQPDGGSQDEINAATQLKGTDRAPDVFDLGGSVALANLEHVRPLHGRSRGIRFPTTSRTRTVCGRATTPATCRSGTTPTRCRSRPRSTTCSSPRTRARSLSTATRRRASAGFNGVVVATIANGGSADDFAPGRGLLLAAQRRRQPPARGPGSGHDRLGADADRHRLGLQQRGADRRARGQGRLEGRRPRERDRGRLLQPGDQRWTRAHPAAARLLAGVRVLARGPEHLAQVSCSPGPP
ncbi:MAG: hypothetical protein MZV63_34245 [Marinilabiliales bacterium]|nr:hypothetical protein [Marinilabiliales bacterium]